MSATVRVWDLPIRLFHWLLVGLVGFSWWSGHSHLMDWHRRSGYVVLALLVFRIYWGFFGSRTARFAQFLRGPAAVIAYARSLKGAAEGGKTIGHNPMGGWSVALLLLALVGMVTAGLFAVDVDGLESGPLADYVSFDGGRAAAHFHGFVFNLLLALVALHIAAILFYRLRLKTDLVLPMVTGRGPAPAGADDQTGIVPVPLWRVLVGILLAGGAAWAISKGFRLFH